MKAFIDTSVIMYAGGADHPLRESCRRVLRAVVGGDLDGVTSTEVVQEILHRFSRGDRATGAAMARATLDLFEEVVPIDRAIVSEAVAMFDEPGGPSARDSLHVATCRGLGIPRIVSVDTDFDDVEGLERIDPTNLAAG